MKKPREPEAEGPDEAADAPSPEAEGPDEAADAPSPEAEGPDEAADAPSPERDDAGDAEASDGAESSTGADGGERRARADATGAREDGTDRERLPRSPAFAKDFPADPALRALVVAFSRGDFRSVRERGPALARETSDEAVRRAALLLVERTSPDPKAKVFFALAAALLVVLTAFWIAESRSPHAPPERRPVEYVK